MLTDIEASQLQTISPDLGSLDSCMYPGNLRQDCFVLTGDYQKLVLIMLGGSRVQRLIRVIGLATGKS